MLEQDPAEIGSEPGLTRRQTLIRTWIASVSGGLTRRLQARGRLLRRTAAALTYSHAGQSMVEYTIIVALITLVVMLVVQLLGQTITDVFSTVLGRLQGLPGMPTTSGT
ncbi:MAG TPA: hypothetical protein VHS99_10305 [Chloroflexota bacterium]|nr:hypothetical protein [Chloroflexota bacterium]